jgi:heat shock protein HtpX
MGKRIFLFIVTNIAVVLTLTIILNILGVGRYVGPGGIDIGALAAFSFVWGMGGAFISLLMSRWIAKMATGAVIVDGHTGDPRSDRVYAMIAGLTQKAGLPMPEVGIYDSPEVNAFATGPSKNRALVAVSTGLLRSMRDDEVEGVLGHEVTHIANGDMVTMTLLQGVINAFVIFFARLIAYVIANRGGDSRERGYSGGSFMVIFVLQIVLGILGSLITNWFSRQREFRADRGGAQLAGRERMIGALRRLAANEEAVDTQHQALATLKINGARNWAAIFTTHPPLEARIAALERMSI